MNVTRLILIPMVFALAACAKTPEAPPIGAFDLTLTHPAPNANYIRVAAAPGGTGLPQPQQIISPGFSTYLQDHIGCVRDASRPTAVLGNRAVPAGYMVPITCP